MFSSRTYPLFFLSFIIIATFFTVSYGDLSSVGFKGLSGGRQEKYATDEIYSRRMAVETSTANSTYMILAANRTHRRDPLDNYQYYTGGWDLTNKHYSYSLLYSARWPVVAGLTWAVLFGLCLVCMCFCSICCSGGKQSGYSRCCFVISLVLLTFLTFAVICGSGILYNGQQKFHKSIVDTSSYLIEEGNRLVGNLSELEKTLATAKDVAASPELKLPEGQKAQIEQAQQKLTNVTQLLRNVTDRSPYQIPMILEPMRWAMNCLSAILLVMAVFGFVFCICGVECLLNCLVMIGWILVLATFLLSSGFLVIQNATADTCVAIDEWLQNPNASSALENVIPKVNSSMAAEMMNVSKNMTFGSVSAVNTFISNVSNADVPPQAGPPLYYGQSGPRVPLLCNPYNPDFTDRTCAVNEVALQKASEVWKRYVCQVSDKEICTSPGRLTPSRYNSLTATLNVLTGLNVASPFMTQVINASYLKNILGRLSDDYCPNLVKYTSWMFTGFITSTIAVMLSVIIWLIYSKQSKNRHYTKKVDRRRNNVYAHQYI